MNIQVLGLVDGQEQELVSMFSKFSKLGDNVIELKPEQLKELKEFKLVVTSAESDPESINCKPY